MGCMAIYEASVEKRFTARHAVCLPDGSFEPAHEHLWCVTATFRCEKLNPPMGVVVDFLEVESALSAIIADLEGGDLNRAAELADAGASAERVAEFIAKKLMARLPGGGRRLYSLAVTEAAGCRAAYYPQQT